MKAYKKVLIGLVLLLAALPLTWIAPKQAQAAPDFNLKFGSSNSIIEGSYNNQSFQVSTSLSPDDASPTTTLQYKNLIQTGPLCSGTNILVVDSVAKSGQGATNKQSVIKYKPAGSSSCQTFTGSSPIGTASSSSGSGGSGSSGSSGSTTTSATINWSGAKGVLSSDGTTITVTYSDNSTVTFTSTGTASSVTTFKPENTGNAVTVGGATVASWCTNTAYNDLSSSNPSGLNPNGDPDMGILMSSLTDSTAVASVCYDNGSGSNTNQDGITIPVDTSAYATAQSGSDGSNSNSEPTCESNGSPLSWITCAIIETVANVAQDLYHGMVQPLLKTPIINFSDTSSDPTHTYAIWSNFRIYGDIFLVIALLVIVFGEALGGGLIDAYSVRKILPRLLIAAVLINLSIYIVAFALDITNILGNGLEALIEAPFKDAINAPGAFTISLDPGAGALGFAAIVAGSIWAFYSIDFIVLFFFLPALLILIAIAATALLRRGLILILLYVSPIAFALYCLPNTERYFRQWWDLLMRTLMVYPLIAIMFGMGNILSVTINKTTTGIAGGLADLLSLAALFAPLALIPFSFRIAGGLLGRFHDLATNASQRLHGGILGDERNPDSLRNRTRRAAQMRRAEHNWDSRSFTTRFNPRNLATQSGRDTRRAQLAERRQAAATLLGKQSAESDTIIQNNQANDKFLVAAADRELAEQHLNKAVGELNTLNSTPGAKPEDIAAKEAEIAGRRQAIAAARLVPYTQATRQAAVQALAQTGFQFDDGQEGYNQLAQVMSNITGAGLVRDGSGNAVGATGAAAGTYQTAMNNAQYALRGAGRWELGGINDGAGYDPANGTSRASLYEIANGKSGTVVGLMNTVGGTKNAAGNYVVSGPVDESHAILHQELKAALPNAKGKQADEINKAIAALEDPSFGLVTAPGGGPRGYMDRPDPTKPPRTVHTRVIYDATDPAAASWAPQDVQNGYRFEDRPAPQQTLGETAREKARTYERPRPENL